MAKGGFTKAQLRKLKCFRCGGPATQQWRVDLCADGNQVEWRPFCDDCDVALNRLVLEFMGDPDVDRKMKQYMASLES